jgi:hypothetical protein
VPFLRKRRYRNVAYVLDVNERLRLGYGVDDAV